MSFLVWYVVCGAVTWGVYLRPAVRGRRRSQASDEADGSDGVEAAAVDGERGPVYAEV